MLQVLKSVVSVKFLIDDYSKRTQGWVFAVAETVVAVTVEKPAKIYCEENRQKVQSLY